MPQNLTESLNDQIIASGLLLDAKTAVRNYAYAITEAASPQVRNVLKNHLSEAIEFHEQVSGYMVRQGLYYPFNMKKQVETDIAGAQAITGTAATT